MAFVHQLFGNDVIDKAGHKVDLKEHLKGKTVGLYFSAHWCGPCRGFTPVLKDFYNENHKKKNFEIIFVSWDSNDKEFKDYYHTMPWLGYFNEEKGNEIGENFGVEGIPTLILMDPETGDIHSRDARGAIQFDKKSIDEFPWKDEK